MKLARLYWRKIRTCDVLLQNLVHEFSPLNTWNGACLWQQTCCRKQSQMKTLWGKSSRAMRRGSIGMTRRWNVSLHSRSLLISRGQRKRTRCGQKSVMLIVFFDMEGNVHYEYVPQGQTVNQQFYLQVLKCLRLAVSRKRPQKRVAGALALHHDNAPAHTAHSIQVFLASHGIPVIQQPPYSPDMAPCDFWLFPQLKTVLKGKRFEDTDAIKKNATSTLNTIPKHSFQKCFQQCQDCWKQCVSSQREYFENYWIFLAISNKL